MKNITEIRKITKEAYERKEAEKKQRLVSFIENKVEPIIIESAQNGENSVEYLIRDFNPVLINNVAEILKEEGYKVTKGIASITIEW